MRRKLVEVSSFWKVVTHLSKTPAQFSIHIYKSIMSSHKDLKSDPAEGPGRDRAETASAGQRAGRTVIAGNYSSFAEII